MASTALSITNCELWPTLDYSHAAAGFGDAGLFLMIGTTGDWCGMAHMTITFEAEGVGVQSIPVTAPS